MTACWPETSRSFLGSCCHFSWRCFSFWLYTDLWGQFSVVVYRSSTTTNRKNRCFLGNTNWVLVFPKKHLFFLFNKLDSLFPILGSTAGRRKAGRTLHARQRSSRPSSSWISSLQWPTWSSKRRKLTGETLYTHCHEQWTSVNCVYMWLCLLLSLSLTH